MDRVAEFMKCKCGYNIIAYVIEHRRPEKQPHYHFFDGHSGDFQQCFVCPGCKDRLNYETLEG